MNLKSMKIHALVDLKNRIDSVLASKVSEERRALEIELEKLTRFGSGGKLAKPRGRGVGGKVAPKYRNPENPSETWAGRGLKPRWLSAALKSGRKLDDFNIGRRGRRGSAARKEVAASGTHGSGGGPRD
jgi:DNA-binding protein H-NS